MVQPNDVERSETSDAARSDVPDNERSELPDTLRSNVNDGGSQMTQRKAMHMTMSDSKLPDGVSA